MRIISRKKLKTFWAANAETEQALRAWFHEAKIAKWKSFQDIRRIYPTADVLPNNRVIFDIKGNAYRLVVKIHYNPGIVFIRFVGAHAQYDRIDPESI
jgi:mRNA interferase HigB